MFTLHDCSGEREKSRRCFEVKLIKWYCRGKNKYFKSRLCCQINRPAPSAGGMKRGACGVRGWGCLGSSALCRRAADDAPVLMKTCRLLPCNLSALLGQPCEPECRGLTADPSVGPRPPLRMAGTQHHHGGGKSVFLKCGSVPRVTLERISRGR